MNDCRNTSPAPERAGAIWCAFAAAIRFPDEQLRKSIGDGEVAEALRALLTGDHAAAGSTANWAALSDAGKHADDLPVEYTRLFDNAARGACSLNGSAHQGPQMETLEEVVRFYNHFGVAVADDAVETPDHLAIELEFVHCLAYGEADQIASGEDPAHYARARRDFIARHPGRLVTHVCGQLAAMHAMPYHAELFRLLDQCLQIDLGLLETQYGPAEKKRRQSWTPIVNIDQAGSAIS